MTDPRYGRFYLVWLRDGVHDRLRSVLSPATFACVELSSVLSPGTGDFCVFSERYGQSGANEIAQVSKRL